MSMRANPPDNAEIDVLREAIETGVLTLAKMDVAASTGSDGYLRMVEACAVASGICDTLQMEAVQHARHADHSWATIGKLMGISRQAAQQRFSSVQPEFDVSGVTRTIVASASNEMKLLVAEGAAGFHLIDFGLYYLKVTASNDLWEHRREIALHIGARRHQLEAESWIYVGAWLPFHYFKRKVGTLPRS